MTRTPLVSFMEAFAGRKGLRRKVELEYRSHPRPRLYCGEPAIVARFISELRQEAGRRWPGTRVLLRGQPRDHEGMVPAILRIADVSEAVLRDAEGSLVSRVQRALPKNMRFRREQLPALLQHYGVRTTWLDVVDDLRVGAWFATHDIAGGKVRRRPEGSGWIYLLSTTTDAGTLTVSDLRHAHHGLSLRPHVQQGWSVCGPGRDLNGWVIGTVEFAISDRWHLDGHLANPEFLFPAAALDDTLGRLARVEVTRCLRQTEREYRLTPGTLGDISDIR